MVLDGALPGDLDSYPLSSTGYFSFGYMQTKWVCEKLLLAG